MGSVVSTEVITHRFIRRSLAIAAGRSLAHRRHSGGDGCSEDDEGEESLGDHGEFVWGRAERRRWSGCDLNRS